MVETRRLAAILCSDIVGYSRLASVDEDHILARLRTLRSDLIDPTIAVHNGRVVKRTGDGSIVEFRSAVDAVRCAIEVQNAMVERNAGVPEDRRIVFRIGIHIGDVVEESDGDLMGDGVNVAARLEGIAAPGAICLSEDAYRQVRTRVDLVVTDLGQTQLKNIVEAIRVYSVEVGKAAATPKVKPPPRRQLVATFAVLAAVVAAAGAAWYWTAGRTAPTVAASEPVLAVRSGRRRSPCCRSQTRLAIPNTTRRPNALVRRPGMTPATQQSGASSASLGALPAPPTRSKPGGSWMPTMSSPGTLRLAATRCA